jgi:hypothetical protein
MSLPSFGKDHAARILALEELAEQQANALIELSELLGEVLKQLEKRKPGRPKTETTQ